MRANRVLVAAGIEPFTHRPEMLQGAARAPRPPTSRTTAADVFKGQNVSSSAAARAPRVGDHVEHGADVEVLRGEQVYWLHGDGLMDFGPFAPLFYAPTDVGPIGISRPWRPQRVPPRAPPGLRRDRRTGDPAGGCVVASPRMTEILITTGTSVVRASPSARDCGSSCPDGTKRKADHLLFATGYKIDIQRYPFLDNGWPRRSSAPTATRSCVAAWSRRCPSCTSSAHLPPAATGLRFVAGSWFTAGAVTWTVLKSPRRRTVDLGRRAPAAVSGPDVPGTSLPTHARQALGRHADDRCAGRRRELPKLRHAPKPRAAGASVVVLDDEISSPGPRATSSARSRWTLCASRVRRSRPRRRGRAPRPAGWVPFPTREETVAAISSNRDRLLDVYRVPTPSWETVRQALDKGDVLARAGSRRGRAPLLFPRTEADLEQVPSGAPVVIKPAIKENFFYATSAKAWRADTPEQLRDAFRRASQVIDPSEIIVQEMIPGAERAAGLLCVLPGGEPVASMTVRRRQAAPLGLAERALVETVDLPEIEEPSQRFLKAVDYYGLAELASVTPATDGPSCSTSTHGPGATTRSARLPARLPLPALPRPAGERVDPAGHERAPAGSGFPPTCPTREGRGQGPPGSGLPEVAQGSRRRCGGR